MEVTMPIKNRAQVESMKKLLRGQNLRDYSLFVLGVNSGLRVSDIVALRVGDVLDVKGRIKNRIKIKEKKTGKTKDFPVAASAAKALVEYLTTRPNAGPDEPLFLSRQKGRAITRHTVWETLSAAAKAVGITDPIGSHSMRKTMAFHIYMQGGDLALVQQLLNHSSPSVTLRYIGITREQMDRAVMEVNL